MSLDPACLPVFVGLDWAAEIHAVCVLDHAGRSLASFTIDHSSEGIASLIARLAKYGGDKFTPWLTEQFDANRPWREVATDLLLAEGDPAWTFYRANGGTVPQPNLVAASSAKLFLGVQLSCAECHNHPFAPWTQDDFWSQAAFFGRIRTRTKGDFTLTEEPADAEEAESGE